MPTRDETARVLQRIKALEPEMVAFQTALTALPAMAPENGGEGEWDKAMFLKSELKRFRVPQIEQVDAPHPAAKGGVRPNLIATLPGTKPRNLWIMAHMDVVPPGERTLWQTDPWKAEVREGRIYGRGTQDNQQGLTSAVFAARALIEEGMTPAYTLRILLCADEETHSHYGLQYLLRHVPERFRPDDLVLVPDWGEPGGNRIEIAEKSVLWLGFRTFGRQCHASEPDMGVNAFRAGSDLVVRLGALKTIFPACDPLYVPPCSTFEPTKKEANVPNINTIPGEDVFYLDCRVLPQYSLDDVMAQIERIGGAVENDYGVRIGIEIKSRSNAPAATSREAPVVRALAAALREDRAVDPALVGIGGATVATFFRAAGIPAAVWNTSSGTAHQPNEYCLIANMVRDAQVFARMALIQNA
jgi:succinyl-diaminopimelate desuccinylase